MSKIHYSESESRVIEALRKRPNSTVQSLTEDSQQSRSTVRNALIKAEASSNLLTNYGWPRQFSWVDIAPAEEQEAVTSVLKPDDVKPSEFGMKFSKGVPAIVKALNGIHPERQDREIVMKQLGAIGSAVLGLYVALGKVEEGPEWRKEAGL